jgi:hypothetical protein
MNIAIIETLFLCFFVFGILAYIKGKQDKLPLLISLGRRSAVILGVLIVVYNVAIGLKGGFA